MAFLLDRRSRLLTVSALDQVTVSLAQQGIAVLAVMFRAETHLSVARMSVLMAAVAFGSVVGMIPAGLGHDRLGPRQTAWISGSWAVLTLGTLGVLLPHGFWALFVLLAFLGVSLPALSLVSLGTVTTVYQGTSHQGLAVGIRQAAGPFGGIVAASVLPGIAYAWSLSRVLTLLALVLGGVTFLLARTLPRRRTDRNVRAVSLVALLHTMKGPLWASFLLAPGQYALLTFAVMDLHEGGGRRTVSAGILLAVALLAGLLARLLSGYMRDRIGRTGLMVRLMAAIGAGVLLLWAILPRGVSLLVLTVVFAGMGIGLAGWSALVTSWIADRSDAAHRGLALGLAGTVGLFGVIIWLPAFGFLQRTFQSYRPGWLLIAALAGLLALTLGRIGAGEPP